MNTLLKLALAARDKSGIFTPNIEMQPQAIIDLWNEAIEAAAQNCSDCMGNKALPWIPDEIRKLKQG